MKSSSTSVFDYYNVKKYKDASEFADYWADDFDEDDYDDYDEAWDAAYEYWNEKMK